MRGVGGDGRGEERQGAAGIAQQDGGLLVDAAGPDLGQRADAGRGAQQHVGEGDGVDADVEQRAAAEGRVKEPAGGVERGAEAEVGLHHAQVADGALVEQAPRFDHDRQESASTSLP